MSGHVFLSPQAVRESFEIPTLTFDRYALWRLLNRPRMVPGMRLLVWALVGRYIVEAMRS